MFLSFPLAVAICLLLQFFFLKAELIKDNLSENKQRLIVDILDYCGVSISEENDIIRNANIDCCIGTAKDCSFYVSICFIYGNLYIANNSCGCAFA